MHHLNKDQRIVKRVLWLFVLALLIRFAFTASAAEQKVDVLKTRTATYNDVTVTKKTSEWVFILHSKGMENIKVSDLTLESRRRLGFSDAPTPAAQPNAAATSAAPEPAPQTPVAAAVPAGPSKWKTFQTALSNLPAKISAFSKSRSARYVGFALLVPVYLFFCLCCRLICRKAHATPGILIWVPGLQMIPLLRAANMSPILLFVPVLNIIAMVVWCFKIVQERGKAPWIGILLLLPVTNVIAFLYLAFSDEAPGGSEVGGGSSMFILGPA